MVYILIAAFLISLVLVIVLRGSAPGIPYKPAQSPQMHRLGELPDHAHLNQALDEKTQVQLKTFQNLDRKNLESFCRKLIEKAGLRFRSIDYHQDHEFHILSTCDKPIIRGNIIVCGFLAFRNGIVSSDTVIGFSDMVKAERAMKGVFVTNGFFSEEVMKLNEGASMELIDVSQLAKLMEEFTPELLPSDYKAFL